MPESEKEKIVYKGVIILIAIVALYLLWCTVSSKNDNSTDSTNTSKSFSKQSKKLTLNRYNTSCPEEKTCYTWSYGTDKSYYDYCMQKNCAGSTKESFMVPPSELKLVQDRTKMLGGSLISSSNNPFMGSLPNEAKLGVTAPQRQGPITVSLSNSGNESKALWSTIV